MGINTALNSKQIEFMEHFYSPLSLIENLIPENINTPQTWPGSDTIYVRNYQEPALNYASIYADDPKLSKKENFRIKRMAGDCFMVSARGVGKSFLTIIDCILSIIYGYREITVASCNDEKLKKICAPIASMMESHKFLKVFHLKDSRSNCVKRDPLTVTTEHGVKVYSVNEKSDEEEPGVQYHSKHSFVRYFEECCVDGNTQIHWFDKEGKIYSGPISRVINQNNWQDKYVRSYNFDKQTIELKKIINIFKNQVFQYFYWDLRVENFGNTQYRRLKTSQHQKIWTSDGYKEIEDIQVGDILYTDDYYRLTDIQKQILIGTLLGDACLVRKGGKKNNPAISFVHGKNQTDYLKYKQQCFKNLFRSFHRQKNKNDWNFQKTSYGGEVWHVTTDTCLDLYEFINLKKGVLQKDLLDKYLTKISLAFWVMDDGFLLGNRGKTEKVKYLKLNTQGFNEESHLVLKSVLKEKFDIDANINIENRFGRSYNNLTFDNINTLKIVELIREYIHPTLYYKIFNKVELCEFIYKNETPSFFNLSLDVKDLLQPVTVLSKEKVYKKAWTMYDIEVEDNHNFFASSLLISNSYASAKGAIKAVDAVDPEVGCIERPSGIPDLCVGSPLGKILNDKKYLPWIWRVPAMIQESWDEKTEQDRADLYKGKNSSAYKLNILAEVVEGAFGCWDMARLREMALNKNKTIKFFEIGKDDYQSFENRLVIERLPGATQCFISIDEGYGAAPSDINIIFFDGKKYKYVYNISLFRLTNTEQEKVVKWLYDKLGTAFIASDNTGGSGTLIELLYGDGVPEEHLLKVKFTENIDIDIEQDANGNMLVDKMGQPIMKQALTMDFAEQELQRLFYDGLIEVPLDEKFLNQFTNRFAIKTGTKTLHKSKGEDHLYASFLVWAISRFNNEFKILKNQKNTRRGFYSFGKKTENN